MSKYNGPKAKVCRTLGVNIYGADKYDRTMQRKPQPAGKGPRARLGRKSEFAQQLAEKQKMRLLYGLTERQFRRVYDEAISKKGQTTGDVMKQLLERRLDNVLYRAGFAQTRLQARQFAGHGLFTVNGRRVTTPSYSVQVGDKIAVRTSSKNSPVFGPILAANEKHMSPEWLKANAGAMEIEVTALPAPEVAEQAFDIRQVIEYYSRR
jgi:small subunit ribosomal protein S4